MSVQNLVVKLQADVKNYVKKLKDADKQNKKTGDSGRKLKAALIAIGAAAGPAVIGLAAITGGSAALGVALGAVVRDAAKTTREFENLSRQTKLSVDDFKAVTFATNTLGVSAEQFADISKDIADKLGEFAKLGTGPFEHFADIMNMSTSRAQELAKEMENLSSVQVIGRLVSEMQSAGISSNEMTSSLEALGNDLSRLTPLFVDQSSKLKTLVENYQNVNETLKLTREEAQNLQESAAAFDLLTASMLNAKEKISAQVSPAVTGFINEILQKVPSATESVSKLLEVFGLGESTIGATPEQSQEEAGIGNEDTPEIMTAEAMAERQSQILQEKLNGNQAILESDYEYFAATVEAYKQMLDEKVISEEDYNKEVNRLSKERARTYQEEAEEQKKRELQKINNVRGYIGAAMQLSAAFLEDNKAVNAGLIVANTASAIMASLRINPYDYGNVAMIAATGLVQLGNALSSSKGGGSLGGGSVGGTVIENDPEEFNPEQTGLSVTSNIEGEGFSRSQEVRFNVDDNEDFIDAMAYKFAQEMVSRR